MQTKMRVSENRLFVSTLLLTVITGCMGPVFRHTRAYEVPADSALWGDFGFGKTVRLKQDMFIPNDSMYGSTLEPDGMVQIAPGVYEQLSLEEYKANPDLWSQYRLVQEGTKLRCVRLRVVEQAAVTTYRHLLAEILEGEHRGKTVDIGALVHFRSNSEGIGALRANLKFVEVLKQ
jgi:hypothetical protein